VEAVLRSKATSAQAAAMAERTSRCKRSLEERLFVEVQREINRRGKKKNDIESE